MARVAVDLARQIFETLEDKRALLVGAGEMIEMALDALRGAGLAGVAVANRTPERAAELAARFGASAHGLDELPQLLAGSDVVLTSIGVDRPLLDAALFEDALRARRRRPIFAIDLGVPRNIDPAVNQLDDVYLYDVDDLGGVAEANAEERRRETVRAEAIVQEEVERFDGWLSALQAVPTIRRLRARAESIRQGELDKAIAEARSRRGAAARRRGADARAREQAAARAGVAAARTGRARGRPRLPRSGEGALRARRPERAGRGGRRARATVAERRRVVLVKRLRLATRGSQLALAQSGRVARRVEQALGVAVELVTVRTSGDRLADVSLAKIGGKGLFVKEIEEALLDGRADLAVHSAKDLPARIARGARARRVPGARRSARRAGRARRAGAQLLGAAGRRAHRHRQRAPPRAARARCVPTSRSCRCAATSRRASSGSPRAASTPCILACAGLDRLELGGAHPRAHRGRSAAAGGGAGRARDRGARRRSARAPTSRALSDPPSARAIGAERAFLARLEGDCNVPLAAFAERAERRRAAAARDGARAPTARASRAARRAGADPLRARRRRRRGGAREGRRRDPRGAAPRGGVVSERVARPRAAGRRRSRRPGPDHAARRRSAAPRRRRRLRLAGRRASCSTSRPPAPSASTSASAATTAPSRTPGRDQRAARRARARRAARGAAQGRRSVRVRPRRRGGERVPRGRRALRGGAGRDVGARRARLRRHPGHGPPLRRVVRRRHRAPRSRPSRGRRFAGTRSRRAPIRSSW